MKRLFGTLLGMIVLWLSAGIITSQELKPNLGLIREQWGRSPHAMSMDSEEERKTMNTAACAHCHTAQGFWEVILDGKESSAPYENPAGLTCITCHFPKKIAAGDGTLRTQKPESACTGCHDILVQNDSQGFSSCLQGSMLSGIGGAHFSNEDYPTGAHTSIPGGCVGCHMAATPDGQYMYMIGGHSFRAISKGKGGRHLNPSGCLSCHEAITLADVEKSQLSVRKQMAILEKLLPKFKEGSTGKEVPRFPKDPGLTETQEKASYNYYYILKDGTWGIHNPVYIQRLLADSIQALEEEKTDRIGY